MNYYGPREIADESGNGTGKWRYTVRNDDRVRAVGFCAEQHCQHDTPEEAREHYRQYEVATAHEAEVGWPGNACRECGALTQKGYAVGRGGMGLVLLCDEHRTRDVLNKHVVAGDAISSY